jgi:hypothetical protein
VELQGSEATVETALRFSWRSSDVHDVSPSASAAGSLRRLQDLRQEAASKAEVFGADVGMPALVADLQSGLEHLGISVKSIKPGAVDTQGPWARCPIVVRGSGSLESMFKFLVVASRQKGVISLTPLALVRDPTPAALHGLALPPLWTLELTVTRAWKVGKAASRTDSGWSVDDALDAPVLDGLSPFYTGSVPGRDQALESPRLIPTPQIRRSEVGDPSRLDHELRDLREASAKAELAWVGSVQQAQTVTALVRMRGRVTPLREGDELPYWPWKIAHAGVWGIDLTWAGPASHRPLDTGAQIRWRLDASGVQRLPQRESAP